MKIKTLVGAIALATAAFSANAAIYNLGTLALGDNYLAGDEDSVISVAKGSFTDTFNFSLASLSSVDGSAGILNYSKFFIKDTTFSYTLYNASNVALASGNNTTGFSLASLTSGAYSLSVTGVTSAAASVKGGLYAGALTVTAVPEPESYAMLLAGLGLVGTIARRRNKASKAV